MNWKFLFPNKGVNEKVIIFNQKLMNIFPNYIVKWGEFVRWGEFVWRGELVSIKNFTFKCKLPCPVIDPTMFVLT